MHPEFPEVLQGERSRFAGYLLYEFLCRFHSRILPRLERIGTSREFHEGNSGCGCGDGEISEDDDEVIEVQNDYREQEYCGCERRPKNAAAPDEPERNNDLNEAKS